MYQAKFAQSPNFFGDCSNKFGIGCRCVAVAAAVPESFGAFAENRGNRGGDALLS
ncbi:hypothetical protein [Paenibacillus cymbidii]|uniref:hypothetical protein n=1 Tax=Paenibacillus cymbidii TaxID=1639034 RepID=UPI0014368A68|nr:hypothetical protein [Paenibacillus cymbidii]